MIAELMKFHPDVANALAAGRPVVALESTLITHGLPHPINLEVAQAMEQAVRDNGATPATIAVLRGQITVGLTSEQLTYLAQATNVRKCSRRDFPIVLAQKGDGATTVAGTMIVAHLAGIKVFATGGIGGVHRGHPVDVSADLLELAQTPVAVVCAGAKAILDLPLTLEVLETHGVPVVGYGCAEFPAFYSRSSGLPLDVRCDTVEEIAAMIRAREQLGFRTGMLITNPIPAADELPAEIAEAAIQQALQEADAQGIRGKETTPFLLARVSELTGDRSRAANIALLKNNARVAAQIAKAIV
ncbi:MAG TPA: pseudouridine-5'-phosphate glycosidase [Kiritimatiellia bacterium]|nr:MAG: Pseudouridine-5'-phosphate glycosidase [Verrucomicrobia bacterium ADurb.Bin018]HOD99546.1 pseudouridine-5'-phosphate glycosidase [Kiritimatiellia bacterium]HQM22266.1 pseudouridine-5'-phosphate glycosidase [Kiritimatiellia bacterium]